MIEIKPPARLERENALRSLFAAGGISGCSNWQAEFAELLTDVNGILVNPRRDAFDVSNQAMSVEQIEWEYDHLQRVDAISFWFTPETLCPIALFELGSAIARRHQRLIVGIHPEYRRKLDVEIQLRLARPDIKIVYDLTHLSEEVRLFFRSFARSRS